MNGYYKTIDGKFVELRQRCILDLCYMNIIELVIPDGRKSVSCHNNQLKKLIIPNGCDIVGCWNNQLKEFIIPNGCEWVWADMKSITELNEVDRLYLCI